PLVALRIVEQEARRPVGHEAQRRVVLPVLAEEVQLRAATTVADAGPDDAAVKEAEPRPLARDVDQRARLPLAIVERQARGAVLPRGEHDPRPLCGVEEGETSRVERDARVAGCADAETASVEGRRHLTVVRTEPEVRLPVGAEVEPGARLTGRVVEIETHRVLAAETERRTHLAVARAEHELLRLDDRLLRLDDLRPPEQLAEIEPDLRVVRGDERDGGGPEGDDHHHGEHDEGPAEAPVLSLERRQPSERRGPLGLGRGLRHRPPALARRPFTTQG